MKTHTTIFAAIFAACLASPVIFAADEKPSPLVLNAANLEDFKDFATGLDDPSDLWQVFQKQSREVLSKDITRLVGPGGKLELTFTQIDRAGEVEPWRNPAFNDVRYVREIYSPYAEFSYVVRNADGAVVCEGKTHLRDMAFLYKSRGFRHEDMFYYETEMLRDWVNGELRRAVQATKAAS